MEKPKRIQLKRTKGWKLPPNTVIVDRRSKKWGNPFVVSDGWDAFQVIKLFRNKIIGLMAIGAIDIRELRGKNLACWCKLGEPCHADVLLELANKEVN